jgi:hypothetical protein
LIVPGKKLLESLSFIHLAELFQIDDNLKRTFYEVECIKGCWSVRELKRQIASLYYERSGLSKDKKKLAEMVESGGRVESNATGCPAALLPLIKPDMRISRIRLSIEE